MFENKPVVIALVSVLLMFTFIPASQAELWELVIDVNVEKGAVYSGDIVVVTGKVVDHAYDPIRGAEVLIRTGADTTKAFTDPDGVFRGEFKDFERVPGTYTVNVIASWYGMTGLSSTSFQVKGEASQVSLLQQKLSTEEAKKYLLADESDFERDPIGQTLYKYYQGLMQELLWEKKASWEPNEEQIHVDEQRIIADELREQAIDEYDPGAGTYGGYQYDDYVNNLNPEIRDLVVSQLNFTKNLFEEAQKVREQIIADGGTYEEARQAYLEMISIPKSVLEDFNQEKLEVNSNQTQPADEVSEN